MIPSEWALCIASSVAMLIKLNDMVQFQTWESGLHILITNEACRGSVQVCFPVKQEDKENICNADCILYALWVDPQWRGKGDGIVVPNRWRCSKGCEMERRVADACGIPVVGVIGETHDLQITNAI